MHLKTGSFAIGLTDIFCISAAFGRGVYLYLTIRDNPMAASWFVVSTLMAILGAFATLSMFYGIWKERYLWTLPKLVVNVFTIILLSVTTVGLVYLVFENSQFLIDLVAEHVTSSDYEYARFAVKVGGTVLVVVCLVLAVLESWFFIVQYRCFKYLKRRYLWCKVRDRMDRNKSPIAERHKDTEPQQAMITTSTTVRGNHESNQYQYLNNLLPKYFPPPTTRLDTNV